jgi:hypothetical protein
MPSNDRYLTTAMTQALIVSRGVRVQYALFNVFPLGRYPSLPLRVEYSAVYPHVRPMALFKAHPLRFHS